MEIYIAPDVFQEKISLLFHHKVHICAYMVDLIIISNDTFENQMNVLYDILNQLAKPAIQENTVKCEW